MRELAYSSPAGNGSGSGCGYCVGKSGTLSPAFVAVVAACHYGSIAVIHGRGVDAVFIFTAEALSGPVSALIVWTASSPSSSPPPTGGFSWSCVHSPLKLLR